MYYLERFLKAQDYNYQDALNEIRAGRKQTHWMWYVFPQITGLGYSMTAKMYAIRDLGEAREYAAHPVLGKRLKEMCEAALSTPSPDAGWVFGSPDDMKLRSSMTLFEQADPDDPIYGRVLDKFFGGRRDDMTLEILRRQAEHTAK